jgi:hypothetical protein
MNKNVNNKEVDNSEIIEKLVNETSIFNDVFGGMFESKKMTIENKTLITKLKFDSGCDLERVLKLYKLKDDFFTEIFVVGSFDEIYEGFQEAIFNSLGIKYEFEY